MDVHPTKMVLIGIDPYPFWKSKKNSEFLGVPDTFKTAGILAAKNSRQDWISRSFDALYTELHLRYTNPQLGMGLLLGVP